jgi:predicted TIM-barrel fold metal-dependent hydrolase
MMQHLHRRGVIGAGLSLATSGALATSPAVAKDPRVTFAVPDGAADCHHHIYDPRFPYNPNAVLKPPYATVSDYLALQKKLGSSRNVMVQPSTYGTDNACVLDVLAQLGENCRAVCVVNSKVGNDELKKLNAAGVRGVRVQFGLGNPVAADEVMPLAKRIAPMGWHIQCNTPADQLVQMMPLLLSLPVPVIIDHLGRAVDDKCPQYEAVRKLLASGHGWVKLSGAYLYGGGTPPDYAGASLAAKGYLKAAPERCVWGSDWPHPDATKKLNPVAMPDDIVLLDLLSRWAPDAKLRHQILVENPERFYGFDPAKRPKAN